MKHNVQGIRFVADAILQYENKFSHTSWGGALLGKNVAGTGASCGSTACVAGFTVQFLGDETEWSKLKWQGQCFAISKYALHLLKLGEEWNETLFYSWPKKWLIPESRIEVTEIDLANRRGLPDFFIPNPQQVHEVLHRLADQLEAEILVENEQVEELVAV